jgi:hypothetical protein
MKKFYLTVLSALSLVSFFSASAQLITSSNFSNWTSGKPDGWFGTKTATDANFVVSKDDVGAVYGTSSVKLENTFTSHKRFTTQPLSVTANETYEIKLWVKGNGDFRTGVFDNRDAGGLPSYGYIYNSYLTATGAWAVYTQQVTALNSYNQAEFIVSVAAGATIQIDSISIAVGTLTVPTFSIYDLQYTTDPSGNSPQKDQVIATGGIVTATHSTGYFVQAGKGAWSGIFVVDNVNKPSKGDSLLLTGKVIESFSMTQLSAITSYSVSSSGNSMPVAVEITTAAVKTELYESVLIKVKNATCTNANAGFGMWKLNTGADSTKVHNMIYTYTPILNTNYDVTGPVYYSYSEYRIIPRDANDVVVSSNTGIFANKESADFDFFPNPAMEALNIQLKNNSGGGTILSLIDSKGAVVYTSVMQEMDSIHQINLLSFSKGIYVVKLEQGDAIRTKKLLVQ